MRTNRNTFRIYLCIIFIFSFSAARSQNENNGTVSGHALYARNGKPCSDKFIDLIDVNHSDLLNSTMTDSSGYYHFENIPSSVYIIKCFESLDNIFIDTITVTAGKNKVHDFSVTRKYSLFPPVIFNLGIHQGWRTMGEISVGTCHGWNLHDLAEYKWYSVTIGSEFNFNPHHFIAGPKITYNHQIGFLIGGLDWGGSLIYYTDFERSELYLKPYFGINIITLIGLHLGYNIPLYSSSGDNPMHSLVNHFTVSLVVSLVNHDKLME